MVFSGSALKKNVDAKYRYGSFVIALLSGDLANVNFTIDTNSNELTTNTAHGLTTGSRINCNSTGVMPAIVGGGNLSGATTYFVYVVDSTTLTLHLNLNDATFQDNKIEFQDSGTGTLSLTELILTVNDPLSVLVAKEVSHADYERQSVTFGLSSVNSTQTKALTPTIVYVVNIGASSPTLTYRHVLIIQDGGTVIGDDYGDVDILKTESANISVPADSVESVAIQLSFENA